MTLDNLLLNSLITRVKIEDPRTYRKYSDDIRAAYVTAAQTFERNNPLPELGFYRNTGLWQTACIVREKEKEQYALQKAIHMWDLKKGAK